MKYLKIMIEKIVQEIIEAYTAMKIEILEIIRIWFQSTKLKQINDIILK